MFIPDSISAVWFTFLLISGSADLAQQERYADIARDVTVGMTASDVESLLGPPTQLFEAGGILSLVLIYNCQPKHYCYGASVHLDNLILPGLPFPNPLPIQIRSFGYADTDVVIRLSATDEVTATTIPKLPAIPEEFHDILDARNFISTLCSLAMSANGG
ncbi:hypothetical protein [Rhodopirellula halodulae]|uniref:hypothetical protein n=1 Tax=Rhodopirellula halodulae TaxID=2894198 RepID=UPI001E3BED64|nr:hypothetical protein [Rhodopirellula sp. JC737]MCC9658784.1 hypothetical protein [Rhodopirellula sp. JC737]